MNRTIQKILFLDSPICLSYLSYYLMLPFNGSSNGNTFNIVSLYIKTKVEWKIMLQMERRHVNQRVNALAQLWVNLALSRVSRVLIFDVKSKKKKKISVITRFFVFRDATIGCYCEDGYARNTNHVCIPIKDWNVKTEQIQVHSNLLAFTISIINNSANGHAYHQNFMIISYISN